MFAGKSPRRGPKKPGFFRCILDMASFSSLPAQERQLVFYSEGKTYWVHLEGILKAYLELGDTTVCYITSDCNDPGLQLQHPRLKHFHTDEGGIRNWLFENMDAGVLVMTMPDLHQYQVKRSKHPVHYAYVQHSLVSLHMVYRSGAFDHFDSIFCAGPYHLREVRAMEARYQLPQKQLVEHGYGRLDSIIANRGKRPAAEPSRAPHILVAPSWGDNSISDTVIDEVLEQLLTAGYTVTYRPHPQTVKFCANIIDGVQARFGANAAFNLEVDVASEESLHLSDLMICDWSGAALDYAFGLEKPVLFVDVPRKVNNERYVEIDVEPFEVGIREQLGGVVAIDELKTLPARIEALLSGLTGEDIGKIRDENVFNVGSSGEAGAVALRDILHDVRR